MARNLFEYHPQLGYRFIPGLRARVRHEGGGYLVRVNQAGFRCEHELLEAPPRGGARVLLFGDSYTAGEGVSNRYRFGDLVEARIPGLQVLNFGLPGSGTDQQYLAWREFGRALPHALLVLCPLVENIRRNLDSHRLTQSSADGRLVLRAKPYFRLVGDELELQHQPVPREVVPREALPDGEPPSNDVAVGALRRRLRGWNAALDRRLPGFRGWTQRVRRISWPPEYERRDDPAWRLMRAILARWIAESPAPALLCPLPTFDHIEGNVRADGYRARFAELARDTGAAFVDLLPTLQARPRAERRLARFPTDEHPTRFGHELFASALAPELERRLARAEAA
jgi:lysophospholipase L1-like esterase